VHHRAAQPLSDELVVKIEVFVGQKEVTVPIELKDIPLP
jgi:hypothetical protein